MIVVSIRGGLFIRGDYRMENKNYYDILGVSVKASFDEITAAKNMLAKKYHPDANIRNGIDTTEQMQDILEAFAVLSDVEKRAEYDRSISGRQAVMQTFDLHEESENNTEQDSGFVVYWKASSRLYEIISESYALFKKKDGAETLKQLAQQALPYILLLREGQIPERYWLPDTMNWLLFTSYKNRNYTTAYLLTLYDEHMKKSSSVVTGMKQRNKALRYEHSIKKLMKY